MDIFALIESFIILIIFVVLEIITIKRVTLKNMENVKAMSFLISYTICYLLKPIFLLSKLILDSDKGYGKGI
jgi:hypothetical protein